MTCRIAWHLAWCAYLFIIPKLAACGPPPNPPLPPPSNGFIRGIVVASSPVANAVVQVYELSSAGDVSGPPRFEIMTDSYGRFMLDIGQFPGLSPTGKRRPFLVTARGGDTRMLGSSESIQLNPAFFEGVYAQAVVTDSNPGAGLILTLSPLTTVVKVLGDQRFAEGKESTYLEAVREAYVLASKHFLQEHIENLQELRKTVPAAPDVVVAGGLTTEVRYMLALAALWTMEQSFAARSSDPLASFALFEALVEDARGPGAILDGVGPNGRIALGTCTPACELGPQTLRTELANVLAGEFIPSPANGTGLDFWDVTEWLARIAENDDVELFGNEPPAGFDDTERPEPAALASPFFDESKNVVRFDASLRAVHEPTEAALVDLASVLGDDACDRMLHKHVDTLRAAMDENPLRWRLSARDNLSGVGVEDIRAVLRPGGAGPGYELTVTKVPAMDGEAAAFDIVVPGDIPELAQVEGRFEIEIQASDRLGNLAAPLVGCWQHVPLAAPVHVAPLALASGPGSLAGADLDNDDVVSLLGGTLPAERGYPLVRIPVTNGSGEVVYLTPQLDELTGTYDRTFVSARALVREDARVDTCITGNPPTCSTVLPREPRQEDRVIARPLPALTSSAPFVALRVVDAQSGAVVTCEECRPGEARLDPGRSYEVQVVATSLDFLLRAGVDADRVARIQVGPSDDRQRLVGIVDEVEHVHCVEPDAAASLCRGHQVFDLYQALTEARIDIQTMRISARTAPSPSLPSRTPRPSAGTGDTTFSTPLSTSYGWSASEPRIPSESGL